MNAGQYTIYGLFAGARCRYVGATTRFEQRIRRHELDGWIKKIPTLTVERIWRCLGNRKAIQLERLAILIWKPDLNRRRGGGGELVRTRKAASEGGRKAWGTRIANLRAKLARLEARKTKA